MIALSTAFKSAQIAVELGGKTNLKEIDANCKVSENVLLTLNQMLDDMGQEINNNDVYAVVVGPGSFTGLRIGIATVKGLCAVGEKKVIPLSSLGLIAYAYIKQGCKQPFCAVINALSGLFFVCEFDEHGNKLGLERMLTQAELDELQLIKVGLDEENLPMEKVTLSASTLLEYAKTMEKQGNFADYHTLSPVYLRRSQAEVMLDEKNNKKI